ncbi:uncharacterized protein METZ01_LOCUS190827, partial [marine metagenome]
MQVYKPIVRKQKAIYTRLSPYTNMPQ